MEVCLIVIFQCLFLSIIYVFSLYIWKNHHERDHPSTIKRRFASVFIVGILSPIYLYICLDKRYLNEHTLWELMGIRVAGLWQAAVYPCLLTVILFLGPICLEIVNGSCVCSADDFYDLIWLRNHFVAPLSEELTFRACMVPLFLQCFQRIPTVFICPIFFGTAHFHHLMENLRAGLEFKKSLLISSFQLLYTSIFGAYTTFLFLRTGHLMAPVVAHAFCNHMGLPDVGGTLLYSGLKRYSLIVSFVLGLILWCTLLIPMTEPSIYHNNIFWDYNHSYVMSSSLDD